MGSPRKAATIAAVAGAGCLLVAAALTPGRPPRRTAASPSPSSSAPEVDGPRPAGTTWFSDTGETADWREASLDGAVAGPGGSAFVTGTVKGNVFAARLDPAGRVRWTRWANDARDPSIVVDAQGSPLVLLTRWSDSASVTVAPFLVRLTPDGDTEWQREAGEGERFGKDLVLDPSGLAVTVTETGDTQASRITWWERDGKRKQSTVIPQLRVSSLAVDRNASVAIAGDFFDRIDIAGHSFQVKGGSGIVIARLGAALQPIWAAFLGATGRVDPRVRFDGNDNLVALTTVSEADDDLLSNLLLLKIDRAGRTLWQKRMRYDVEGEWLGIDDQDGLLVTARLRGAIDFGAGVLRGWDQGFVASFDPNGAPRWARMAEPKGCLMVRDASRRLSSSPSICSLGGLPAADAGAPAPLQARMRAGFLRYKLDAASAGLDGSLLAVQDRRISGGNHRDETCFGWDVLSGGIPGWDSPPLDAALQLVDEANNAVGTPYETGAPMIVVDQVQLHGQKHFLVTRKHRVCRSRWQVDRSTLVEVRNAKLREVASVDDKGENPRPIWLLHGMMASFRIQGDTILSADSSLVHSEHPAMTRFSWEGERWVRRVRYGDGEGWFGEHFPERSAFP